MPLVHRKDVLKHFSLLGFDSVRFFNYYYYYNIFKLLLLLLLLCFSSAFQWTSQAKMEEERMTLGCYSSCGVLMEK